MEIGSGPHDALDRAKLKSGRKIEFLGHFENPKLSCVSFEEVVAAEELPIGVAVFLSPLSSICLPKSTIQAFFLEFFGYLNSVEEVEGGGGVGNFCPYLLGRCGC